MRACIRESPESVKSVDERILRLDLEFDGAGYFGWQYQPRHPTIQAALEQALARLFGCPVHVNGVGRTDTGVSALNYTVSFLPPRPLEPRVIQAALNQSLPRDIMVRRARRVGPEFHARYSARSRLYRYTIVPGKSPLLRNRAWEVFRKLDFELMRRATGLFIGEHNFAPFCRLRNPLSANGSQLTAHCGKPSAVGRQPVVFKSAVRRSRDRITGLPVIQFEVEADHFLYKLVRRMVGALVDIGTGRNSLADLETAISRRPLVQFSTAPACGLVFVRARY